VRELAETLEKGGLEKDSEKRAKRLLAPQNKRGLTRGGRTGKGNPNKRRQGGNQKNPTLRPGGFNAKRGDRGKDLRGG